MPIDTLHVGLAKPRRTGATCENWMRSQSIGTNQVHTVTSSTLASYNETLTRGTTLVIEMIAPTQLTAETTVAQLAAPALYVSVGFCTDVACDTMWEYQPQSIIRDDMLHL
jgi:alanyl-tRNA synthetase